MPFEAAHSLLRVVTTLPSGNVPATVVDWIAGGRGARFLSDHGPHGQPQSRQLPNRRRRQSREVLSEMDASDELRTISVIVFTTSTDVRVNSGCDQIEANYYAKRSFGINRVVRCGQPLKSFWFAEVILS
jgi:hypothetical protein